MKNKFERTCIACHKKNDKKNLLRIVKNKTNNIYIDVNGNLDGRGTYVCLNKECCEKVYHNKLLNKAFKTNVDIEIYEQLKII